MKTTVIREIASRIVAIQNCIQSSNKEWEQNHRIMISYLEKNLLPCGSGVDNGSHVDLGSSTPNKIVIRTSYHHMNDAGMYDGWTEHKITVTPSLCFGFDVHISGPNRNGIKDYLADLFHSDLQRELDTAELHEREKLIA